MILKGIKARIYNKLKMHGDRWVDELLSLFYSIRTSISRSNSYTPFFLA